jgi:GH15 family glucan-1,4-alpha-glucosidase
LPSGIRVRDAIYRDIFENFWDGERQAFVQHKGSRTLDAASLLMPLVKFMAPTDPRWISHLKAVEAELVDDSLVYRYRTGAAFSDGLAGSEGTFSMCSFWYVECLCRAGDLEKARFFFEKMLGYANHLGLYGEELGARGEHLGNFPQAFTHLALISAAYALDRAPIGCWTKCVVTNDCRVTSEDPRASQIYHIAASQLTTRRSLEPVAWPVRASSRERPWQNKLVHSR